MADAQNWIKGMVVLNAAREVLMDGGLSKVKLAAATATLSRGDKSDVRVLCDIVGAETLSFCHELSQLSTDSKRALVEGAAKLKDRSSIDTDAPRGLLSLISNIPHNGAIPRKLRSQQSMFEQASDHPCASCKSLVQKGIILRSLPTLRSKVTWQWCQLTRVFEPGVSTSLAALLLFLESVIESGGAEHKWALYNALCRADTEAVLRAFATVDPAKYCGEVKVRSYSDKFSTISCNTLRSQVHKYSKLFLGAVCMFCFTTGQALLCTMLPEAPFIETVQACTPTEEFNTLSSP
jgi:hypothetical protein